VHVIPEDGVTTTGCDVFPLSNCEWHLEFTALVFLDSAVYRHAVLLLGYADGSSDIKTVREHEAPRNTSPAYREKKEKS
jgi:hypothetical protein